MTSVHVLAVLRCTPKRCEWSGSKEESGPSPSALGKKKSCMVWKNLAVRLTCSGTTLTSRCSLTVIPATGGGGSEGEGGRRKRQEGWRGGGEGR